MKRFLEKIFQGNGRMSAAVILLLYLLIFAPFFLMVAGDAQVHLAVAERFVDGHPFTYNADEIVVASTSPFWTILLVALMHMAGPAAVLLLKVLVTVIYALVSAALYAAAGKYFRVEAPFIKLLLGLWLLCIPVLANAVSGLEKYCPRCRCFLSCCWRSGFQSRSDEAPAAARPWGWFLGGRF